MKECFGLKSAVCSDYKTDVETSIFLNTGSLVRRT